MRHGDSEPHGGDDSQRELTGKGVSQAEWAGRGLAAIGAEIEVCLTSPKVRAVQSARIACEQLGMEPEIEERLRGGGFDPLELATGYADILLVGHEPDLSDAVALVTGGRVRLRKGGIAAVEPNRLHVLFRPKDLRVLAGEAAEPAA